MRNADRAVPVEGFEIVARAELSFTNPALRAASGFPISTAPRMNVMNAATGGATNAKSAKPMSDGLPKFEMPKMDCRGNLAQ